MEQYAEILSAEKIHEAVTQNRYTHLMQAVVVAVTRCQAWRIENSAHSPYSIEQLSQYAIDTDKDHPLTGDGFYVVSIEGAIGYCPGLEYQTVWMFVPMEPCPLRDFMHKRFNEMSKAITDTYNTYQAQVQQNTNQ